MATHHTKYLWDADCVVVFEDGRIVSSGPPEDILDENKDELFADDQSEDKDFSKVLEAYYCSY